MKTKNNKLIIIGAGSLGVMTLDAVLEMNCYDEVLFIDDNKEKDELVHGFQVMGGMNELEKINVDTDCIIAIANNRVRKKIAEENELNYINIIHPKAAVSRYAQIGIGNIVLSNSSVDPNVEVFNHVIINKNNSIGHNSTLQNYSQVSPGCSFGGFTELKEGVFTGLGSVTIPSIIVGNWSIIGAGTVVTKNLPNEVTAVGVPARIVKEGFYVT